MNALNELKKWMIENNDDDTPLHPSDIYKKIDELIASQPYGGKSAEDILQDFGCPEIPFDENVTMYYPAIISAMEEYASQYAHQQPVNDGWRVYNTGVDITEQCTFESGVITINSNVVHRG